MATTPTPSAKGVIVLAIAGLSLVGVPRVRAQAPEIAWRALQPGLEFAVIDLGTREPFGDNRLTVVRIDPARSRLDAVLASARDGVSRTARDWCEKTGLAAAINIGMYQTDHSSNVGYLRTGAHLNNPRWVKSYYSALAFGPNGKKLPPAILVDLDVPGAKERLARYDTVVQNLRLIKGKGKNVWTRQEKRWSEAAVAIDGTGRVLFLFCRTPFSMWEFNERLRALPLDIERAMHVEGGPEASLSIHAAGVDLDLHGSFETGFFSDDGNSRGWPVPNVLGVARSTPRPLSPAGTGDGR